MANAAQPAAYFVPSSTAALGGWLSVVGAIALLGFAAFSGLAVAYFGVIAVALVVGMLMGLISLFIPLRHFIVLLIVSAFLIMGQLMYFAGIAKAFWIPFLLGLVLLIRLPAELMRRNERDRWQAPFRPAQSLLVTLLIGAYFATLVATTLINLNPPLQILVSGKEYFFLWGLYFVIAAGLVSPSLLAQIWRWLPWLLVLQLPMVLYQRFVVASRRSVEKIGAAWDAVVGAFGGDPNGGGMSGAMGIFVVFAVTLAVTRWRQGSLRTSHCALLVLSGLAAVLLAEVKFAVLMLPIAIGAAFLRDFFARPLAALGALAAAAVLAGSLLFAYKLQYWNAYQQARHGGYENVFTNSADPDFINMRTGEMGRVAALTFWASRQADVVRLLIGHGMGASRKGEMVTGAAAKPWPFNIARSSLAILLWETGLIGTAVFIGLFGAGFLRSYQLAQHDRVPATEKPVLLACGAGLVILLLELPYNTDALYAPQIQLLLVLIFGQIAVSGGRLRHGKAD
jgi:hypothetical protein